jgi:nucleoside-diphosphate-sugar epimerase
MKKVLLTGASGFIGRHAIPFLLERGYEVHAVSSKPNKSKNIHWHETDLLNSEQTALLLERIKPSHLLHFAWYAVPGKYWTATENLSWVAASLNLLNHFAWHGGRRVVMAGTCAEYDWHYPYCDENLTPLVPQSLYGSAKHGLQSILSHFSVQNKLSSAWGRIFYLYGPFEQANRLVPSVILSLLNNQDVKCTEGLQVRDFSHVEDTAGAFVALLESNVEGNVNIASGSPVSVKDVINRIHANVKSSGKVLFGAVPRPAADPDALIADMTRLTKEVGWKPNYDLNSGLAQTIAWWKQQLENK